MARQLSETERINEELSQYAYAVSHDLKDPLRAIRNYADFLYEDLADTLSGDQKQYLEGMQRAVRQGEQLIGDLLDLSRIDASGPGKGNRRRAGHRRRNSNPAGITVRCRN